MGRKELKDIEYDYLFNKHQGNLTTYERMYGKPKYFTIKDIEKWRAKNAR